MNRLLLTCEVSEGHRGAGDGGHPEEIEEAEIGHCFREWWVLIDNGVFWLGHLLYSSVEQSALLRLRESKTLCAFWGFTSCHSAVKYWFVADCKRYTQCTYVSLNFSHRSLHATFLRVDCPSLCAVSVFPWRNQRRGESLLLGF